MVIIPIDHAAAPNAAAASRAFLCLQICKKTVLLPEFCVAVMRGNNDVPSRVTGIGSGAQEPVLAEGGVGCMA